MSVGVTFGGDAVAKADALWVTRVEPLLDRHCFKCHGGVRQKGGLDLRSLENQLRGGDGGAVIEPGEPMRSRLVEYVMPGAETHMPPDAKKQLSDVEIGWLRDWVASLPKKSTLLSKRHSTTNEATSYVAALRASRRPSWKPPSRIGATQVVDEFVRRGWKERRVKSVGVCDDATFVRRVHLDLVGRIPMLSELEDFEADRARDKRERLVDALLNRAEHGRHWSEVFDVLLMGRANGGVEQQRRDHGWYSFLECSFQTNRPWNQVVADLIRARPSSGASRGSFRFLYERKDNHQAMAEAVAPVAFGVRLDCAQCHNHPLAAELEQRHYWGLVAAFNRSKNVDAESGPGVSESAVGGFVNFANLKKESQPALLAFPNGRVIEEHRPADGEKENDGVELYGIPPPTGKDRPKAAAVPRYSRRGMFAEVVSEGNPLLARAFVNRVWGLLFGRGITHPVDQMDSKHPPSHPDLLDWLARDFERSGYDTRRLIRTLVLTRTYQQGSRPPRDGVVPPESFARALEKPLTAEQLVRSLRVVAGRSLEVSAGPDDLRRVVVDRFPDVVHADYNASLAQAMFLSNSVLIDGLWGNEKEGVAARLAGLASPEARVVGAFRLVLGRLPDAEELRRVREYLGERPSVDGVKHVLWALVSGPEFQLNH